MSILFRKVWFTEAHDFDLMSKIFFRYHLNIDQLEFINRMINTALDMEVHNEWSIEKYPLIFFEDDNYQ